MGANGRLLSRQGHGPRYVEIFFNLLLNYYNYFFYLLGWQDRAYANIANLEWRGDGPRATAWG